MWPHNELTDRLGIECPILQAPMGGESTPAMVIAVCEAGGLGGLGCSFMTDAAIRGHVGTLRGATSRPFNLNFFAHPNPHTVPDVIEQARSRVAHFYRDLGLNDVPVDLHAPCDTFSPQRLELLLELVPKVVSFHFGLPSPAMVAALKDNGSIVLCSATTVAEARSLAAAGVDAVIAQGWEAGGHRGTFHVSDDDFGIGGMALIPQIVDAVDVPVIAAGGIADGRGIAAALMLGASGVQLGSAFLSCPEADISAGYRRALGSASDEGTRLTRAFSGRPARARNNRYIQAMATDPGPLPAFPTMYGLSDPLQQAADERGEAGFEFFLWGQAAAMNRELGAGDLVRRLVEETGKSLAAAGTR